MLAPNVTSFQPNGPSSIYLQQKMIIASKLSFWDQTIASSSNVFVYKSEKISETYFLHISTTFFTGSSLVWIFFTNSKIYYVWVWHHFVRAGNPLQISSWRPFCSLHIWFPIDIVQENVCTLGLSCDVWFYYTKYCRMFAKHIIPWCAIHSLAIIWKFFSLWLLKSWNFGNQWPNVELCAFWMP